MTLASIGAAAGSLALVLAAAFLAAWLLRRVSLGRATPAGSRISLVDSLQIDPRRRVVLLRCEGRQVLLAIGGGSDILLDTWQAPPEPSS